MVLIPDGAHGTNPASATMAGFRTVPVKSTPEGFVDLDELAAQLDDQVAVFMITNPNTLGLFEPRDRADRPRWSTRPAGWSISTGPT